MSSSPRLRRPVSSLPAGTTADQATKFACQLPRLGLAWGRCPLAAQATVATATQIQVAIIGGGPAGLLLSHMLHLNGIDSIVLERQSRAYVLQRIRAGVLEAGSVDLLRAVGLGARMDREGHPHDGSAIAWEGRLRFFIDTRKFTGRAMMAYGQTAITEDLYAARDAAGGERGDEAGNSRLHELTSERPYVTYEKNGAARRV